MFNLCLFPSLPALEFFLCSLSKMAMLQSSPWQIHYHLCFLFKCEMRWGDGKHNKSEICNGSYSSVILRSCLASRVVLAPAALCNCALRRGGGNTGCFHSGPYPVRFKENSPVVMAAAAVVSACQACRSPDDEQSSDWCFPAKHSQGTPSFIFSIQYSLWWLLACLWCLAAPWPCTRPKPLFKLAP